MSEYAESRYDQTEDSNILLSQRGYGESSKLNNSLWMARWRRARSSSGLENGQSSGADDTNKNGYAKEQGATPFKIMKTTVAEKLMVGMRQGTTSSGKAQQFNKNVWNLTRDVYQTVECKDSEQADIFIQNSMMQKDGNLLNSKEVVSNGFSVQKLSDSSFKWENSYHLLRSDHLRSEWSHFPMFEVNKKIDSIFNPKRKPGHNTFSDISSVPKQSASHVLAYSSNEYQFHTQRINGENMEPYIPVAGALFGCDYQVGSGPDSTDHKRRHHISDVRSCSCRESEKISSSSQQQEKEHSINTSSDNSKQQPHDSLSQNRFMIPEVKNGNKIVESTFRSLQSRTCGGFQDTFNEHHKENYLQVTSKSDGCVCLCNSLDKSPQCFVHHLKTERIISADNLREFSNDLPNAAENLLTEKSRAETLASGKQPVVKLTDSGKKKGPCLFEMLTLPSKSYDVHYQDLCTAGKSTSADSSISGKDLCCHLLVTQNESSAKTDTLYIDLSQKSISASGLALSAAHKDSISPNPAKSDSPSTLPDKRVAGSNNKAIMVNEYRPNSSGRATSASKLELSISKTVSMNVDQVLSDMDKLKHTNAEPLIGSQVYCEPSERWIKRLRHEHSDTLSLGSKRLKFAHGSSGIKKSSLFTRSLSHNETNSELKHVKDGQQLDKTVKPNNCQAFSPPLPVKTLQPWIRRWCCNDSPQVAPDAARPATELLTGTGKSNLAPEALEGHFPSIAALAMMGKAMNKIRPCEFQRKGPAVVWNTEEGF